MDQAPEWKCPGCGSTVSTAFCARCGEEPLHARDLSLKGIAEKLLHGLTSIDARAARTAWNLVRHPGKLTLAWSVGLRKPYVAPFQIFLLANLVFFALQSITGTNVFSSPLASHLHAQDWNELAQSLVEAHLRANGTSLELYAPVFDHAVVLHAKSLIGLMAIPFALLLPLLFVRTPRPFMVHVTFSLHVYAFLLLLFCAMLLAAKASELAGIGGLETALVDDVLSVLNLLACGAYLYLAIGPVYAARGVSRALQAATLAFAAAGIVLGYRFLLFVLTLYVT